MTIRLVLTVFGWQLGTFDIRIDLEPDTNAGAAHPVIDRGVKRVSRWWTARMVAS